MQIIFSLIVAVLFYKIKLIDDRKHSNFEKFKNYLRSQPTLYSKLENQLETWLEKDIPYQLMAIYKGLITNEGAKQAILDYYKDYRDNERTRKFLFYLIIYTTVYLILTLNGYSPESNLERLIIETLIVLLSVKVCLKQTIISLFNNSIINVDNSEKAERIYSQTQYAIEKDITISEKKFKVKRNAHTVLYNDNHEIFLQERDANACTNPNTIGLFGGALKQNESPMRGVFREFKEETEYKLSNSKLFDARDIVVNGNRIARYVFYEKYDGKFSLKCKEGKQGIWLNREQIRSHSKIIQIDKDILEKFFSEIIGTLNVSK